jgi:membrane-associated phospholipid phosphatase
MDTPAKPAPAPEHSCDPTGPKSHAPFLVAGAVLLALCPLTWSIDGPIHQWAQSISLGGDIRRTLETIQQFGDGATVALSCILIYLLDPSQRKRIWILILTVLAVSACTLLLKMSFGRPRPVFEDPSYLCGPFGTYPVFSNTSATGLELRSPWQFWLKGVSNLWSFPSSHTSGATALGLSLWWLYPRLKPLIVVLLIIVATSRVILNAHYITDVLAGAAVGLIIAPLLLEHALKHALKHAKH